MERVIERACGLDVGKKSVHACALLDEGGRKPRIERREFATHAEGLRELREWLIEHRVTHVAMEGTGVYWIPIFAAVEDDVSVLIVNAKHVKQVPGRKTDVTDAEWLATLLQHGLLKASFVPSKEIRPIRDLTRYRRSLIHARTQLRNQVIKLLEQTGVKLASVASDAFGRSGLAMLNALAKGTSSAKEIAALARGKMKSKKPELELAFGSSFGVQHRFILSQQLTRLAALDVDIASVEERITPLVKPYEKELTLLMTIPGVSLRAAIDVLAEVGPDMSSFATDAKFASWSGLCPGNNITGGKARRARRRSGNPYLQSTLFECALGAVRTKGSFFRAKHQRLERGRSKKASIFAIAHKLARAVHRVLTERVDFVDLGEDHVDRRPKEQIARALITRVARLGLPPESVNALFAGLTSPPTAMTFS